MSKQTVVWVASSALGCAVLAIALSACGKDVPFSDKLAKLAGSTVTDEATLNSAAETAELRKSATVQGNVDNIQRIATGQIQIAGWAVETTSDATKASPVTVLAFSDGKNVYKATPNGARPDVPKALKLADTTGGNMGYVGTLSCNPGKAVIVVAVAQNSTYAALNRVSCP